MTLERNLRKAVTAFVLSAGLMICGALTTYAATRTVDTTADNAALTACTAAAANDCSLRGAISNAASGDTVDFDIGLTNATITITSEINLTRSITISGLGADKLTISGGGTTRLFNYFGGSTLSFNFNNITIADGNGASAVNSNQGGAMHINGGATTAVFDGVIFRNNTASAIGGVLALVGGEFRIINSTFTNNSSSQYAAIYISIGSLRVSNSTFSGNTTTFSGVIGSNERPVFIRNSTIVNNTGGGFLKSSGNMNLVNTIVAGNGSFDVYTTTSSITTSGGNIIGRNVNSGANFPAGTPNANMDYVGTNASPVNPLLGTLSNNGGTTPTHALLAGSPAINAGKNCVLTANGCGANDPPTALTFDQRGAGFSRNVSGTVDIGAFEYQTPLVVTNDADTGTGSLRDIVASANLGDTIVFDPAFFNQARIITLNSQILLIKKNLTINGTGANLLTIDGGTGDNGIFDIYESVVKIRGVTLQNGGSPSATIRGSAVSSNGGSVTLEDSVVQNNHSTFGGGTVSFLGGSNHQIIRTTIANNTDRSCGGFSAENGATVFVTNSTISGNNAMGGFGGKNGGGFCSYTNTFITVRNSTITNNSAVGDQFYGGGGMFIEFGGTVNLGNTIVAGNFSQTNPDIDLGSNAFIQTVGGNLIGNNSDVSAVFPAGNANGNGDFVGTSVAPLSAQLAPLSNYGGATPTHALFPNSPAINNGNGAIAGIPLTDQRGAGRIGNLDIGAFENVIGFNQNSLPNAYTAQSYNQNLTVQRLSNLPPLHKQISFAPFTFEIVSVAGQGLPNGLSLTGGGNISGNPTTVGINTFTVKATDSDGMAGAQQFTIEVFSPTAAAVSVSGRVLTANGRAISKASITLIDSSGNLRTVLTNQLGFYNFNEVAVGEFYTFNISAKGHSFVPQIVLVNENISDLNFSSEN